MPEIVVHGLELVTKSIVTFRQKLQGGQLVEIFDARTRLVINPEDRIREPGERLERVDPVLQVNPTTGRVVLT